MHLLDINVLVSLALPNHAFHRQAQRWFRQHAATGWATCGMTEIGFIRLAANPAVNPNPLRPADGLAYLAALKEHGQHQHLSDAQLDASLLAKILELVAGHQQVNDAFLLALAASHHCGLATFDHRLAALSPRAGLTTVLA